MNDAASTPCFCDECSTAHCEPIEACEYSCCNHEPLHWGYRFGFELAAIGIQAFQAAERNKAVERLHALPLAFLGKEAA